MGRRSSGKSNFKLIPWLSEYLKWYFYGLATFGLEKDKNQLKNLKDIKIIMKKKFLSQVDADLLEVLL